jgi:hypothetical protein
MKKSLFLSAFLLINSFAWSQSVPQFEFTPHDSVSTFPPATTIEPVADLEIHSLAASDITVKWQRNVLQITSGCGSKVCDLNACYPESFSTKQFVLGAGIMGPISVHLVNNTGILCQAIIRLDLWNIETPNDIVSGTYLFNMGSSGVDDGTPVAEAKIFPNPTADYFTLDQVDGLQRVRVLDLTGREVAAFNAATTPTFQIGNQPAGQYIVTLEDETGKIIAIAQLNKK